jgi:hypothetical protein
VFSPFGTLAGSTVVEFYTIPQRGPRVPFDHTCALHTLVHSAHLCTQQSVLFIGTRFSNLYTDTCAIPTLAHSTHLCTPYICALRTCALRTCTLRTCTLSTCALHSCALSACTHCHLPVLLRAAQHLCAYAPRCSRAVEIKCPPRTVTPQSPPQE